MVARCYYRVEGADLVSLCDEYQRASRDDRAASSALAKAIGGKGHRPTRQNLYGPATGIATVFFEPDAIAPGWKPATKRPAKDGLVECKPDMRTKAGKNENATIMAHNRPSARISLADLLRAVGRYENADVCDGRVFAYPTLTTLSKPETVHVLSLPMNEGEVWPAPAGLTEITYSAFAALVEAHNAAPPAARGDA